MQIKRSTPCITDEELQALAIASNALI